MNVKLVLVCLFTVVVLMLGKKQVHSKDISEWDCISCMQDELKHLKTREDARDHCCTVCGPWWVLIKIDRIHTIKESLTDHLNCAKGHLFANQKESKQILDVTGKCLATIQNNNR